MIWYRETNSREMLFWWNFYFNPNSLCRLVFKLTLNWIWMNILLVPSFIPSVVYEKNQESCVYWLMVLNSQSNLFFLLLSGMKGQPKSRIHSSWIVILVTVLVVVSVHVCHCLLLLFFSCNSLRVAASSLFSWQARKGRQILKEINSGVTENEGRDWIRDKVTIDHFCVYRQK